MEKDELGNDLVRIDNGFFTDEVTYVVNSDDILGEYGTYQIRYNKANRKVNNISFPLVDSDMKLQGIAVDNVTYLTRYSNKY